MFFNEGKNIMEYFLEFTSNHLYGKIRFKKMRPRNMLTKVENVILIKWTLNM